MPHDNADVKVVRSNDSANHKSTQKELESLADRDELRLLLFFFVEASILPFESSLPDLLHHHHRDDIQLAVPSSRRHKDEKPSTTTKILFLDDVFIENVGNKRY